jgi:uncharacterized membrane protein YkoI
MTLLALLAPAALAQDEKVDADKLPQKVKDAIKARFPGATITTASKATENGEVIYDIEMTKDGKKHEMDCKEDGTLVDVENQIDAKDLPAAVTSAVKAKYPNSTIKEVMEVLVVKDKKETRDHFEVVIDTADKKEVELTVSLDGTKIE